jgi:hypothetical protein
MGDIRVFGGGTELVEGAGMVVFSVKGDGRLAEGGLPGVGGM